MLPDIALEKSIPLDVQFVQLLIFIFHDNNLPTAHASPGSLVIPVSVFFFSLYCYLHL